MASLDPYRDWLRIARTNRPMSHYDLLGLRPRESDLYVIRAAALRQVQRLSRVEGDGHAELVSRLLREVAAARDCLLDADQKAKYDSALPASKPRPAKPTPKCPAGESLAGLDRAAQIAPELPPRAEATSPTVTKQDVVAHPPADDSITVDPPISVSVASRAPAYRRRAATARRKRSQGVWWLACGILALAVPALSYVAWTVADLDRTRTAQAPPGEEAERIIPPATTSHADDTTNDRPPREPIVDEHNTPWPAPRRHEVTDPDGVDPPAMTTDVVVDTDMTTDNAAASPPAGVVRRVQESLTAVHRALADRDLTTAESLLDEARSSADHPMLASLVFQTEALRHYVKGFWNAVDRGVAGLTAGQEIVWRDRRAIVVEADASRFILRVAGVNRTFASDELPSDLALLLAERWLAADDLNSPMFIAAFHCVDPDGDREQARAIILAARAQGVVAADQLLAVLDAIDMR